MTTRKAKPSKSALAMQACEALIEALDPDRGEPFLKRRLKMLSAIDKACVVTDTRFENGPEGMADLLHLFGAELSFFNAGQHEEQKTHRRPGDKY